MGYFFEHSHLVDILNLLQISQSEHVKNQAAAIQPDDDEAKQHSKSQAAATQSDDDKAKQHSKSQEEALSIAAERILFEDSKVSPGHLNTRQ